MPSYHSKKITRRKFVLYATFSSLGLALAYTNSIKNFGTNKEIKNLQTRLKYEIISFNQKRRNQLENNLKEEIIKDHKDQKTIWIGQNLYTYAELSILDDQK